MTPSEYYEPERLIRNCRPPFPDPVAFIRRTSSKERRRQGSRQPMRLHSRADMQDNR